MITSDSGIAVSVMNVVRKFSRNRNRMISTSTAPMTSASPTLKMPRSMKFFSRNRSELMTMSAGSDASTSRRAGVDLVGQRAGVDVRLLGDREDDAGPAVDAAVAALELRPFGHAGHVLQQHRPLGRCP